MSILSAKPKFHRRSTTISTDIPVQTNSELSLTHNNSFFDTNTSSLNANKPKKVFELTHITSYTQGSTVDQTPLETPKEFLNCPSCKSRSTRGSLGFSFKDGESLGSNSQNSQPPIIALRAGGMWSLKGEVETRPRLYHKRESSGYLVNHEYIEREKSLRIGKPEDYNKIFKHLDKFVEATDDNTVLIKRYCKNYRGIDKHLQKLGIGNRENIHRSNTKLNHMEKESVERYVNMKKKENQTQFLRSIVLPRVQTAAEKSKKSLMFR